MYQREKQFLVYYKGDLLERRYNADLVVYDKIILEAKCVKALTDEQIY
jgi:GxxExxY protein